MPDIILDEFKKDLNRLKKLLNFLETVRSFAASQPPAVAVDDYADKAKAVHGCAKDCHPDLLILSGAIVLYLGGRFEFFVRERFEQASDEIAEKCVTFSHLPESMQKSLISMTAEVMLDPPKYGHGDGGVKSFVKNLAANMAATTGLADVNCKCLSITTANMRSEVVQDLFKRVGLKDIWKSAGEQAAVKAHFALAQNDAATAKAKEVLNEIMTIRNSIAHPSANVQWPDTKKVSEFIRFFEVLSPVLCDVISVHLSVQTDHKAAAATPAPAGPAPAAPAAPAPAAAPPASTAAPAVALPPGGATSGV